MFKPDQKYLAKFKKYRLIIKCGQDILEIADELGIRRV